MNKDFEIEDDILTKYNGINSVLEIPNGIEEIGKKCFKNNTYIKEIHLPESVKIINSEAFYGCINLKQINLENIEIINDLAFQYTKINNITLNKIKKINNFAFEDCSRLQNINIKNNVFLGYNIFYQCENLKEINLPDIEVVHSIFTNCKNLKKITINKISCKDKISDIIGSGNSKLIEFECPNTICENGVVYNNDKSELLAYLEGKQDEYFKIPDSVKTIARHAIYNNKYLKVLELGKNVENMETNAIVNNNIEKIIFNNKLKKMSKSIYCISLKEMINFENTSLEEFFSRDIVSRNLISIKLPIKLKSFYNVQDSNNTYYETYNKNLEINGIKNNVKIKTATLEDLIKEGKTFYEASNIIKEQER